MEVFETSALPQSRRLPNICFGGHPQTTLHEVRTLSCHCLRPANQTYHQHFQMKQLLGVAIAQDSET
jgi:hypothetical protein